VDLEEKPPLTQFQCERSTPLKSHHRPLNRYTSTSFLKNGMFRKTFSEDIVFGQQVSIKAILSRVFNDRNNSIAFYLEGIFKQYFTLLGSLGKGLSKKLG
jgi:hypothetical protein